MAVWGRIRRFFSPENTVRVVEMLFALFIVSICFGWNDKGVGYSDLNDGDYNEGGNIVFFMMIAMVSLIFLLCVIIYSILRSPRVFSPCLDIVICSSLSLLTFIATVVMAHSLTNLGKSLEVREAGLNFNALQATLVFGIALALLFAVSSAFAVCFYRKKSELTIGDSRNMTDLPDDIPT
ncbi:uncharacterized protein LOC106059828 [Biomphalaria glabrata]|uniref:Uncharacterized protein LOC106059828 n=1 Tax=Biomphalaria glabrata TaxID=6526 RepID=A0A9W3AFA5_BIOGL|nr:uncharacterized protein LOC106059828 [Biomphalaria glabrata]KAI8750368.1 hypothetical protein BgiMline_017318 [Biomphalaria glabrata]